CRALVRRAWRARSWEMQGKAGDRRHHARRAEPLLCRGEHGGQAVRRARRSRRSRLACCRPGRHHLIVHSWKEQRRPSTQDNPSVSPSGRSTPRVDGPLKVTGKAQYASDFTFPGQLYAVPVEATIANGRVEKIDAAAAEKMPGVRAIFHRENIGKIF